MFQYKLLAVQGGPLEIEEDLTLTSVDGWSAIGFVTIHSTTYAVFKRQTP